MSRFVPPSLCLSLQVLLTVVCGMIWFADAMELMLLSTLSLILHCQWQLSGVEEAMITSVMFLGALIGSIFWGVVGDTFGRQRAMVGMTIVSFLSGVLSAQKLTHDDRMIPG